MTACTCGRDSGADPPGDRRGPVRTAQRVIRRSWLVLRVTLALLMVSDHLDLFGPEVGTVPTAKALASTVGAAANEFYEDFLGGATS
ncbi:hypothetical protein EV383_6239 [Pseudonocardia sediminis]|uniref:Uncharacterized protein n=1 Tax=Pseudonocardia sediminis TaxID=1397368 RepID=A0A4Q7U7N1_PSEST|nr:hypothetical protein EV383_6239 [Pseudonocardia sediminis]